jgi:hypothetical protein
MSLKPVLRGLATYVPGLKRYTNRHSGGTDSARYCYSVWLRHMVSLWKAGMTTEPRVVAELGPGDSLGIGMAAVLSGAERYFALDVKPYFDANTNLAIFGEIVDLFRRREPIPDAVEFPGIWPQLDDYSFPNELLSSAKLTSTLSAERVAGLREGLAALVNQQQGAHFSYFAPWDDNAVICPASVDLGYSQAVMEHVVDVPSTYAALARWIRPGGWMSHSIDFRSHKTAHEWNGHWRYEDFMWKVILGRRRFLINREPHSRHLEYIRATGFDIVVDQCLHTSGGMTRRELARRFKMLTDEDLSTAGTFVIARKRTHDNCAE